MRENTNFYYNIKVYLRIKQNILFFLVVILPVSGFCKTNKIVKNNLSVFDSLTNSIFDNVLGDIYFDKTDKTFIKKALFF